MIILITLQSLQKKVAIAVCNKCDSIDDFVDLFRDGFGAKPCFKAFLAEVASSPSPGVSSPHSDRSVIGYVLYCYAYSPSEGRVLCLEDIYVRKQYRGEFFYGCSL